MHPKYKETINNLRTWSQNKKSIKGAIILGSQVRNEFKGDEWSDLDVLLLADTPAEFMQTNVWLDFLGEIVCAIDEETPLDWVNLTWSVKRVLFADNRTIDFSIMPADRVDDVLSMNAEIHAQGYEILYDAHSNVLSSKTEVTLADVREDPPKIPNDSELQFVIDNILFQIIFACKKIQRQELWVAVSIINQQVSNLLLQLLEFHAASTTQTSQRIRYEGRFLEQRLKPVVLEKLPMCFTKYDMSDAAQTAGHLIDLAQYLVKDICEANSYPYDPIQINKTRNLYHEIFGAKEHWA